MKKEITSQKKSIHSQKKNVAFLFYYFEQAFVIWVFLDNY